MHEEIQPTDLDRDAEIAKANEAQHALNIERLLHDEFGLEKTEKSGLGYYRPEDILHALQRAAQKDTQ